LKKSSLLACNAKRIFIFVVLKTRDLSIDALRGMAIFAMIGANMAANNYTEPHPFLFRLFGSFAAPTFVFLSGFMVPHTSFGGKRGFSYYLWRGLAIIGIACLIDVLLWGLVPLVSFDVLYVIGISMPLAFLFTRVNKWWCLMFALVFFLLTPFIQMKIPYSALPDEIMINSSDWK
jgi:uncharacterized membrane protein